MPPAHRRPSKPWWSREAQMATTSIPASALSSAASCSHPRPHEHEASGATPRSSHCLLSFAASSDALNSSAPANGEQRVKLYSFDEGYNCRAGTNNFADGGGLHAQGRWSNPSSICCDTGELARCSSLERRPTAHP